MGDMRHTGVDIGTQMQEDAIANLARQMELACSVAYTVHDATKQARQDPVLFVDLL